MNYQWNDVRRKGLRERGIEFMNMMKIKLKIIFGTFLEWFILVDYYFLQIERDCVHSVNDLYNLWTFPHFVDLSAFCGQFHILRIFPHFADISAFCGQFHILGTVQHFVPRADRWGTRGAEGGSMGDKQG